MNRSLFIRCAVICTFVLIAAPILFWSFQTRASIQKTPIMITNETESLHILSSKIENNDLVVELRNIGDRPIIAYAFDSKSKNGITVDLTSSEIGFRPGSIHRLRTPIGNLQRATDTGLYKLNISMAFFADDTAEGDWEKSQIQRDKLKGMRLALERVRSNMANITQVSTSSVEKLSGDLSSFTPPRDLTPRQKTGYQSAIMQARIMLNNQSQMNAEHRFNILKKFIERQVFTEGGYSK